MTDVTGGDYRLEDRFVADAGTVFLSGVQALARLPFEVVRSDRRAGRRAGAFVSGYQGSPLGAVDIELSRAQHMVGDDAVVHVPGLNEELAATSVMGTQLALNDDTTAFDSVTGFWYGKGPGFDRATDALRHAQIAGTSASGGAVAWVGDDPACKSSTLPIASERGMADLSMPTLFPSDPESCLVLGRHAVELSRLTGLWAGMKITTPVADGTGTVHLRSDLAPELPVLDWVPQADPRIHLPYSTAAETHIYDHRLPAAAEYAALNGLQHPRVAGPDDWIAVVAAGHVAAETRHALVRLGFETDDDLRAAGIRFVPLQMIFPLHRESIRQWALGLQELVVVEEKFSFIEAQLAEALYGAPGAPPLVGRRAPDGASLFAGHGILDAATIAEKLRTRLADRLGERLAPKPTRRPNIPLVEGPARAPSFCSGCPHNWGMKVPEGATVGAGIGCHSMAVFKEPDQVGDIVSITQMGGEGAQWIGMSPFVDRGHLIQNLGDGTYFHSGQLAIQSAVAAGVDITYKLLYNGTVAMTGGQDPAGQRGPVDIATVLAAQGVQKILVTTEDRGRYRDIELAHGAAGPTEVWDRSRIVEAQEHLATIPGVTVLIHDQACAAENRRGRKRGSVPTPTQRVVINHRVCEACGDCGDVSRCLSVQTTPTILGPKTTIDQTSCNLDFSCLEGDCPSFIVVDVPDGPVERVSAATAPTAEPVPTGSALADPDEVNIRLLGIGGTGVVTVAQILGTAAMLDGMEVRGIDQTGLSQKAGPVTSDLRLRRGGEPDTNFLSVGEADLILGFDAIGGSTEAALAVAGPDRTVAVYSSDLTPTPSMVGKPDVSLPPVEELRDRIGAVTRADHNVFVDAAAVCIERYGSAAAANMFLLGAAHGRGLVPVGAQAIEAAIELNGVAVADNVDAFRRGRSGDWEASTARATPTEAADLARDMQERAAGLAADAERQTLYRFLAADLIGYQNRSYAQRFLDRVERLRDAGLPDDVVEIGARSLHHLMAYKDEYEVARLLLLPATDDAVATVGPGAKYSYRLHPPMLKALGLKKKVPVPAAVARPLFASLARGKRLRGTRLDPFGRSEVRRLERDLLDSFEQVIERVTTGVPAGRVDPADSAAVLEAPLAVRGYEDLKLSRGAAALAEMRRFLETTGRG